LSKVDYALAYTFPVSDPARPGTAFLDAERGPGRRRARLAPPRGPGRWPLRSQKPARRCPCL